MLPVSEYSHPVANAVGVCSIVNTCADGELQQFHFLGIAVTVLVGQEACVRNTKCSSGGRKTLRVVVDLPHQLVEWVSGRLRPAVPAGARKAAGVIPCSRAEDLVQKAVS